MGATGHALPARRRGRPQRLPVDPTPLTARHVGCDQRSAWLLATSRLMHPDPDRAERRPFLEALRARGITADATRISRWESGAHHVPPAVSAAYEDILGLSAGSLAAVTGGLRRVLGSQPVPREPADRAPGPGDLEDLLAEVCGARASGTDWQRLAAELTRYDRVFLRRAEWVDLSRQLVHELSRSVGISHVRRYESAAALLRHPSAREHVLGALDDFVTDPDAQVVTPVLALLAEAPEPAGSDLVLRMLGSPCRGLRRGGAAVAADQLRRGRVPDPVVAELAEHAAEALRRGEPLEGALDAFDVAVHLPAPLFATLLESLDDPRLEGQLGRARRTGMLLSRTRATTLVSDLARAVEADHGAHPGADPDAMLHRLLHEALLHVHKPRRHYAALLLAASPYRHAVARQCHALTGSSHHVLAARAWAVLMRVGHAGRRAEVALRALSEGRPTLQARALVNLGLNPEPIHHGEARAVLTRLTPETRPSIRDATLFALGMSGASELEGLREHASPEVRRGARWWLEVGPAIHDHLTGERVQPA